MKIGARDRSVRGVLRPARRIAHGKVFSSAVLLALALAGCPAHVGISKPPPCPGWSPEQIADYETLIEAEESGQIETLHALHEYLERQAIYCLAVQSFREGEK